MIAVDPFLDRVPGASYNCMDFVREVWLAWFGEDVCDKLKKLTGEFATRRATLSGVKAFTKLECPISPCFVVMQRRKLIPHIGIYLEGRVLHLTDRGVEFQPIGIARRYFTKVEYRR